MFVKDVFGATETKKCINEQQSTYLLDYPFEDLLEYIASCMDIVKLFYNNQTLKAQLNAEQKKNGVRGLVCPAPTCWGSIKGLSSLLDPYVIEEDLSATKSADLENILIRTPMNDHISIGDTRRELLDLQVTAYYMMFAIKEQKDNSFQFKMFMNGCKTPLQ